MQIRQYEIEFIGLSLNRHTVAKNINLKLTFLFVVFESWVPHTSQRGSTQLKMVDKVVDLAGLKFLIFW